jgi:hypothetical protein
MKRSILSYLLFISTFGFSQAPQKFSYQTVIRNSSNQQVGIKISVLQGSETGIVVYSERHTPSTNSNGLATLSIGTGSVLSGNFQNINWGSGSYYIQTETDPNGGNSYTITSTQQLLSVPYALHAKTADSITNGSGTIYIQSGNNVTITGTGTNADPYIVNSTPINNLLAPNVNATDNGVNYIPVTFPFSGYAVGLDATINANFFKTVVTIEYGLTTEYLGENAYYTYPGQVINNDSEYVSGNADTPVTLGILLGDFPNTTYHYRFRAENAVDITYSDDMVFTIN